MALTAPEVIALAFKAITDTNATIEFEKSIPSDVTGLERELRIAEFAFPKAIALVRDIVAAAKS